MLADQLGATLWRVIIDNADWEATNDDPDPATFNWTYYNGVYTSGKFEALWSTLAHLNQKGISSGIILNFMGPVPAWMGGSRINSASEDEWVEMIVSLVYYARVTRGLKFGMLAPMNEPDHDGIEGPQVSAGQYVRLLRKLSQRLDTLGIADLKPVGPDTAALGTGIATYLPQMMADSAVMARIDHFGFHNYAGDTGGADAAIRASAYPTRNFWMTEVTNAWDASRNWARMLPRIWSGMPSIASTTMRFLPGEDLPRPTTWATDRHSSRTIQPHGRTRRGRRSTNMHRFFGSSIPGSRRVAATGSTSTLTVYAFRHPASGRLTIVGRNTSGSSQTLDGTLVNLPAVSTFAFYQTTISTNLDRRPDVPITKRGVRRDHRCEQHVHSDHGGIRPGGAGLAKQPTGSVVAQFGRCLLSVEQVQGGALPEPLELRGGERVREP